MSLRRWRPMHDLARMREEMDRLFDRFFSEVPPHADHGACVFDPAIVGACGNTPVPW